MARRKYPNRRRKKRGRGLPYVYRDKIYFGKRPQMGKELVSKVLVHMLQNVGDVIGI